MKQNASMKKGFYAGLESELVIEGTKNWSCRPRAESVVLENVGTIKCVLIPSICFANTGLGFKTTHKTSNSFRCWYHPALCFTKPSYVRSSKTIRLSKFLRQHHKDKQYGCFCLGSHYGLSPCSMKFCDRMIAQDFLKRIIVIAQDKNI